MKGDISKNFPFYALVNVNKKNDLWWLSLENKKPEHVPNGNFMVIAQMGDPWSLNNWDSPTEVLQK
jgi:predicted NAD/FAD-dependent oxidoreductase